MKFGSSAAQPYVAAFRAYKWNADIASLAERFFSHCPGARHVVLLNEEGGSIDVAAWEKVSHTQDFSEWGLPERPHGQSPWYNGDYTYILLRQRLPDHDHYLVVESDVAVNLPLGPMVMEAAAREIDAVVHHLSPVHPDWLHHAASLAQPDAWRCFLFTALFSGRALDTLLAARLDLARHPEAASRPWPIVESFVPTALRNADLRFAELSDFADTSLLRYRPFLRLHDPATHRPGTLAHPVLGTADLTRALLYDQPPHDYFRPGTAMHEALAGQDPAEVAPELIDGFARHGDHAGVARLHAVLAAHGLAFPHRADLAYAKPALISSTSPWSRGNDAALDAAGANGAVLHAECAFHTDGEPSAWWQVDLLEDCVVDRVEIVNRGTMTERFVRFVVESSRDGAHWATRHLKHDDRPVSSDADAPWAIDLPDPFIARLVRVRRLGAPECLHLRRVRLFGRVIRTV